MTRRSPNYPLRWVSWGTVLVLILTMPFVLYAWWANAPADTAAGAGAEGAGDPGSVRLAAPLPAEEDDGLAPRTGFARAAVVAAERAVPQLELAVAVYDRVTHQSAVGRRGTEPFYTASLAKIVLAVDMLDRRRLDSLVIPAADLALLRRALTVSDDVAMNELWTKYDGDGAATRLRPRLKLVGASPPQDPSQWGEMSVSAVDFVRIWRYVLDEMPSADRNLLLAAMRSAPTTANDGFIQAYGLLGPQVRGPYGAVAKQGWMCCIDGETYLHSSGALGENSRFVVVLLTREPRGPGWAAARADLDRVTEAAIRALD